MEIIFSWLGLHYIEVIATVLGIVGVVYEIKQHILVWPLGIITSLLYIYVYFEARFYADMLLQVYYVPISIYGWWFWLYGRKRKTIKEEEIVPVRRAGTKLIFILALVTILLTLLMALFLMEFTDSPVPLGDGFTTAGGFVATWMLARKIIEHWFLWIIVDATSMFLYVYKGLYPTTILFIVYTIMAFVGYFEWKKTLILQH
jgi:nicotinamide mononucleotide transporter